jgi:DNA repair exonuclease SbcCD ATPase subunit
MSQRDEDSTVTSSSGSDEDSTVTSSSGSESDEDVKKETIAEVQSNLPKTHKHCKKCNKIKLTSDFYNKNVVCKTCRSSSAKSNLKNKKIKDWSKKFHTDDFLLLANVDDSHDLKDVADELKMSLPPLTKKNLFYAKVTGVNEYQKIVEDLKQENEKLDAIATKYLYQKQDLKEEIDILKETIEKLKNKEIGKKNKEIAEKNKEIAEKNKEIAEKNKEIAEIQTNKNKEIAEIQTNKNKEIDNLKATIAEIQTSKNKEIDEIQPSKKTSKLTIENLTKNDNPLLHKEINSLKAEIEDLKADLDVREEDL